MTTSTSASARAIEQVAATLFEATRTGVPCPPIKDALPPNDVAAAYAVQARLTAQAIAGGRCVVGRKSA